MTVALLAGAIVAPSMAIAAGPVASPSQKCKRKHGQKKRSCRSPARIAVSPPGHDFGTIGPVDSAPVDFLVRNVGRRASGIPTASIGGSGARYFQVIATSCSSPLAPGASCTLTVESAHNDGGTGLAELHIGATPGGTASATLVVNLF